MMHFAFGLIIRKSSETQYAKAPHGSVLQEIFCESSIAFTKDYVYDSHIKGVSLVKRHKRRCLLKPA
jgi:hypothetical protein